jgi:hypothetical protein
MQGQTAFTVKITRVKADLSLCKKKARVGGFYLYVTFYVPTLRFENGYCFHHFFRTFSN